MKKVAIIGGGYTGISCAKKLSENNFDVTIFEKTNEIGGIAKCIDCYDTKIEKHYRHIFKSDNYVIELIKELGLIKKLHWNATKMAYYSKDKGLYAFGTPFTLVKYKPLTFNEKIKFGISIVKLKMIKNYKKIEEYTAEKWLEKNCGKSVYKKIWEPLLITKFGDRKKEISMAWLWGKINLRSSSSTLEGEKLGYLDGSFDVLTNKIKKNLLENGCEIRLNEAVEKVSKINNRYIVSTNNKKEEKFDFIISTVSYDISKEILNEILNIKEKKKMEELMYTSAKTLIIYSKKKLTSFYWINIGDEDIPFGGIIEHTNMINKTCYNDVNIIYISNYIYNNNEIYKMNAEELFKEYYPYLVKMNKEWKKEDVIKLECFEEKYAQPIITTNYSKKSLGQEIEEKGVYLATMAQIYPEDRGMNYAIKIGYEIADKIIKKDNFNI